MTKVFKDSFFCKKTLRNTHKTWFLETVFPNTKAEQRSVYLLTSLDENLATLGILSDQVLFLISLTAVKLWLELGTDVSCRSWLPLNESLFWN